MNIFKKIMNYFRQENNEQEQFSSASQQKPQLTQEEKLQRIFEDQENSSHPLICNICQDYLLFPLSSHCGHTFCDYCLTQYFLQCDICPDCGKVIRDTKMTFPIVLHHLVLRAAEKSERKEEYSQRMEEYKKWLNLGKLAQLESGMEIDVRDKNHVWCKSIIIRLINRVAEPKKFARVRVHTFEKTSYEEDIEVNSVRLAPFGFYSSRKDIPYYQTVKEDGLTKRFLLLRNSEEEGEFIILKQFETTINQE